MTQKIQPQHLNNPAYIYLRQSTMGQVRIHQESTKRQYALKEKAIQLGWESGNIRILDGDLGMSGVLMEPREDFKILVADVSMNKVGAVFALEASRLSRSNADWYRLLELCSLTDTLIIDEDGCYHPADFNDQLLLGLKGTMSQAELHFIRARLQGGKLNKAKRGELRFPLPVGYCYNDQNLTVIDPNQEVQGAIQLLFDTFRKTNSAYAVVHYFGRHDLLFPKRAYGGIWAGKLIWGRLSHARVLGILRNPCYTGTYVYGRYKYQKSLSEDGRIQQRIQAVPQDSWQVLIKDHHDAYLSWQDYQRNQSIITANCTHGDHRVMATAARKGSALLQGLLLCSDCGRRMTVRYTGSQGRYPLYQCTWKKREGIATSECFSMRADVIDDAIVKPLLNAIQPHQVTLALQAFDQLGQRNRGLEKQWNMRLQQAEYDAQLAQKRYEEVDPGHRLVAASLEKRWNETLIEIEKTRGDMDQQLNRNTLAITTENRDLLMSLCGDLPKLWRAPSTQSKDKKRIIRLLVKDITVKKENRHLLLQVRWQGGANKTITMDVPLKSHEIWRHSSETVEKVKALSLQFDDSDIADYFNQNGIKTNKGNTFTTDSIRWIRYKHNIPALDYRHPGEITVNESMTKFGVSRHVVYYWINTGIIGARKPKAGLPFYLSIDAAKEIELRAWVDHSSRIKKTTNP